MPKKSHKSRKNRQPQNVIVDQPAQSQSYAGPPVAVTDENGGIQQPVQYQMLSPPAPVPGVPLGLELLIPLNRLFIRQKIEMMEVMTGYETRNRYDVLTGNGERVYVAQETTDALTLQCGGSQRQFSLHILDFLGRIVLVTYRIDDGCNAAMGVNLMDGTRLGEIYQTSACVAQFSIKDGTGQPLMILSGPQGQLCIGAAADYPITTTAGVYIGVIRKTFAGFVQEYLTDADNFGVEFPPDLDTRWKGLLFAAVFLIDFMYYERGNNRNRNRYGYGYGRGYGYRRW